MNRKGFDGTVVRHISVTVSCDDIDGEYCISVCTFSKAQLVRTLACQHSLADNP